MVQGFAEQSGGSFSITSALGRGTTVELRLPAAGGDQCSDASEVPEPRQAAGRILLVDDAVDLLITTSAFLEQSGFVVTSVKCGHEALVLLAAGERFDVLVTDYAMPGMNGADLITEARLIRPETRALLITGYAGIDHAETSAERVSVLHKPFKRVELVAAVHRIMELPDQTAPAAPHPG
jgi:CheY-like chemotaxis protein